VLAACLGFGLVADQLDDQALVLLCAALGLATLGFLLVNWPWGKLFLGDGGAYFLGFGLAWIAVLMLDRHAHVSAFAMLLPCVHPVFEVLFSIYRRRVSDEHPGMPDRLHFHSLFLRRFARRALPHGGRLAQNSWAGICVGLMSLPLALVLPLVYDSVWWSALALLAYVLLYLGIFLRMVGFHWSHPLRFVSRRARARTYRHKSRPVFLGHRHGTENSYSDTLPPLLAKVGDHYRGYYVRQSLALDIRVYRQDNSWCLQLKDEQGRQCLWPHVFETPESAWGAFSAALENRGATYVKSLFKHGAARTRG
jgi:hypothetical protein